MRIINYSIAAILMSGVPAIASAKTGQETSWTDKSYCLTYQPPTIPETISKSQLHIIGVAINMDNDDPR